MNFMNKHFKFRGDRKYLHSATILNHLYDLKFNFNKIEFKNFSKEQINFSNKEEKELFAIIDFENFKKKIFLNKTNEAITQTELYPENLIKSSLDKNAKLINLNLPIDRSFAFTIFDVFICLTKKLNYELFPSNNKWIAADLEIIDESLIEYFPFKNISMLKIVRVNFLKPYISINKLFINNKLVAKTRFSLV